jgi:hypothetical protein
MNKFGYVKLAAVAAVLAIAFFGLMRPSTAEIGSPAALGADVANEARLVSRYADELITYETQSEALGKRSALVSTDLEPLQRKSDDLKLRLSDVQNAVRDVVRKLKAANEWDDADSRLAAKITDARLRSFLQETSFKQDLEEAAGGLGNRASEISSPLDNLRKKLASRYSGGDVQFVRVAATAPPVFGKYSLGCHIGRLGLRIVNAVGTASKEQNNRVFNRCYPDGTINPF